MNDHNKDHENRFLSRAFWLGNDQSAVNINRFWLYLAAIGVTLCAVCFVRAIETSWYR